MVRCDGALGRVRRKCMLIFFCDARTALLYRGPLVQTLRRCRCRSRVKFITSPLSPAERLRCEDENRI